MSGYYSMFVNWKKLDGFRCMLLRRNTDGSYSLDIEDKFSSYPIASMGTKKTYNEVT